MGAPVPRISVIVCTRNRAGLLRGCLTSLLQQDADPRDWELIVVDNASTDGTPEVVSRIASQSAGLRVAAVLESRTGLSHARNRGVNEAAGGIVAFFDDDVVVPPEWVGRALAHFDALGDGCLSVGGPVHPRFIDPRPEWFLPAYECHDWGPASRRLERGESFSGCNMAIRKASLESVGGFPADLGMKGDALALGEDTWVYLRLWQMGEPLFFYAIDLGVDHCIPPSKVGVAYCLRRAFASGRASARLPSLHRDRPGWIPPRIRGLLSIARLAALSLVRMPRHVRWQRWVVEELSPVAQAAGRWTARRP